MKAKRLTALALAAVMAASSMSVSFAISTDEVLDFAKDGLYYFDEDDNVIKSAEDDDYQFRPGDDVYLRLEGTETTSKKKSYSAFATWDIGKSWVDDVDIVYKKGVFGSTPVTTTTYKTTGFKYDGLNNIPFKPKNDTEAEVLRAAKEELNKKINDSALLNQVIAADFTKTTTGYVKDNKWYENAAAILKDTSLNPTYTELKNGIKYDGKFYTDISETPLTEIPASGVFQVGTEYYLATEAKAKELLDYGTIFTTTVQDSDNFYILETEKTQGYSAAVTNTDKSGDSTYVRLDTGSIISDISTGTAKWISPDKLLDADALNAVGDGLNVTKVTNKTGSYLNGTTLVESTAVDKNQDGWIDSSKTQLYTDKEAVEKLGGFEDCATKTVYLDKNDNNKVITDVNAKAKENITNAINNMTRAANVSTSTTRSGSSPTTAYAYWYKISTNKSATTKELDVVGTISVGTSKTNAKDHDWDIGFTLTNASSDPEHSDVSDYALIEPGAGGVLSFDKSAEEVEIEFGDDARFEFNARGQGKLNFAYNTKYNREFARDYESANIDFITFEGEPTANRTGTLYIYVDPEDKGYIYEVTEDGAKKISGAKYDKDEGAWVIRTRKLTSYAISDKKLKTVDEMNTSSSSGTTGGSTSRPSGSTGKPNPDTGR